MDKFNKDDYILKSEVRKVLAAIPYRGMVFGKQLWTPSEAWKIVNAIGRKLKLEAKTKAVRENGKKGGRPKVVCLCGYDPKHPEIPRMDIVCPKHDYAE